MGVFDELKARGLIAQMTNEERVRELLNKMCIRDRGKHYGLYHKIKPDKAY